MQSYSSTFQRNGWRRDLRRVMLAPADDWSLGRRKLRYLLGFLPIQVQFTLLYTQ